jgi:hypothetical protein
VSFSFNSCTRDGTARCRGARLGVGVKKKTRSGEVPAPVPGNRLRTRSDSVVLPGACHRQVERAFRGPATPTRCAELPYLYCHSEPRLRE